MTKFYVSLLQIPDRYAPVEVDYGDDSEPTKNLAMDPNCKLPMPVQQLMLNIFDIKVMQQTLLEFEVRKYSPLGIFYSFQKRKLR